MATKDKQYITKDSSVSKIIMIRISGIQSVFNSNNGQITIIESIVYNGQAIYHNFNYSFDLMTKICNKINEGKNKSNEFIVIVISPDKEESVYLLSEVKFI